MEKMYGMLMSIENLSMDAYLFTPFYLIEGSVIEDQDGKYFEDTMKERFPLVDDTIIAVLNVKRAIYGAISESELMAKYPGRPLSEAKDEYQGSISGSIFLGYVVHDYDEMKIEEIKVFDRFLKLNKMMESDDEEVYGDEITVGLTGDKVVQISVERLQEIMATKDDKALRAKLQEVYDGYNDILDAFMLYEKGILTEENINWDEVTTEDIDDFFAYFKSRVRHANSMDEVNDACQECITVLDKLEAELALRIAYYEKNVNIELLTALTAYFVDSFDLISVSPTLEEAKSSVIDLLNSNTKNLKDIAIMWKNFEGCKSPDLNASPNEGLDVVKMKEFIDRIVIGQEEAKIDVLSALKMNSVDDDVYNKNSCFLIGPTGSGKTLLVEAISKYLDAPMVIFNTTNLTSAGYVGANVEDILVRLLEQSKGDIKRAQRGIVVFDEVDKKGSDKNSDISGRGVLNSLLPFMTGTTYDVRYGNTTYAFDTSYLTIFATGAFTNVVEEKAPQKNRIGFGTVVEEEQEDIVYPKLELDDLVEKGKMPREFMGRFTTISQLSGHTKESLKEILLTSDTSALLSYQRKLKKLGIELRWTEGYLDAVADEALKMKTGARSLHSIVEKSIKMARWEALSKGNVGCIILQAISVKDNGSYELLSKEKTVIPEEHEKVLAIGQKNL